MSGPLIVQSDMTMLLDVHSPDAKATRDDIMPFSELIKSPEHLHTYQISRLSVWNSCSTGFKLGEVLGRLEERARYGVPDVVTRFVTDCFERYGSVVFAPSEEPKDFLMEVSNRRHEMEILATKSLQPYLGKRTGGGWLVPMTSRGDFKARLIQAGFPVDDRIPLRKGAFLDVSLRETTLAGKPFAPRPYQVEAAEAFLLKGGRGGGYGTIVLPCGSGKTVVGLMAMAELKTDTLILCPNVNAARQWAREALDKTTLAPEDIGEYSSTRKEIRRVTVCTYSMLVWRSGEDEEFRNFNRLLGHEWGLVIYDEVHMLPAPLFKLTANMQSVYRLGLTATLVREDGREADVFSLVGPKRYDVPWSDLEAKGFIAKAYCHEIRVPLPEDLEIEYAIGETRRKHVIAACNPRKLDVVERILKETEGRQTLIIGQYLDQLEEIRERFGFPIITGAMGVAKRDKLYQDFRDGVIKVLIVSKVANFAIDLPDASVAIQVSGTFGSRQEEAQRLGRILRPKEIDSHFYTIVSKYTKEEDYSMNRQKFLSEQGYTYSVEDA